MYDKSHNTPYDRGSADAYYGRRPDPHCIVGHERVTDLTPGERAAYMAGYNEEDDRKEFGR